MSLLLKILHCATIYNIQCFHMCIFNLIKLTSNLDNIKKKQKQKPNYGDANYFHFYALCMHLMKDQVVNTEAEH